MTDGNRTALSPAEELRRAFDQSFAAPFSAEEAEVDGFLAIRLGGDSFAIPLDEIAGIERGRAVLPLGLDMPGFLGVAGLRGRLVPVLGLDRLLGYPEEGRDRYWLAIVGRDDPVGVAFSGFEGLLRVPRGDVTPVGGSDGERPYVRQVLRHAGMPRLILDIPRIAAATRLPSSPGKE